MKIEIVEFYPFQKGEKKDKKMLGTIHVYLIDYKLDYRGILVFNSPTNYRYKFPGAYQIDPSQDNKKIFFPILAFQNQNDYDTLLDFLKKEGSEYIRKKLKEKR